MEELSRLVGLLSEAGRRPTSGVHVGRLGSAAQGLRRKIGVQVRQLEREAAGLGPESALSVRSRRARLQLEALSESLRSSLARCGADGLARREDRERLLEDASLKRSSGDDSRKAKAALTRTRDLLRAGLEQMAGAHDLVDEDEAILRGVEAHHKRIADSVRSARAFVRRLRRREHRDRFKMTAAIVLFYCAVLYVAMSRLPFRTIFAKLFNLLRTALSSLLLRRQRQDADHCELSGECLLDEASDTPSHNIDPAATTSADAEL